MPNPSPALDLSSGLATIVVLLASWLLLRWKRGRRAPPPPREEPSAPVRAVGAKAAGRGPMTILFGSQTGTAEGFATTLMREARVRGYAARALDLEELPPEELGGVEGPCVFLLATHGEGDPTDNTVAFHRWASDASREPGCLAALQYAAFGLGDQWQEELAPLGLGDDDGDIDADFESWRASLWVALCGGSDQADGQEEAAEEAPAPSYVCENRELCRDASCGSALRWVADLRAAASKPLLRFLAAHAADPAEAARLRRLLLPRGRGQGRAGAGEGPDFAAALWMKAPLLAGGQGGLEAAAAGRSVVAFVRRSSFRLPCDGATPEMRVAAAEGRGRTGPTRLYFGCRHARGDYLYEDELAAALEGKLLGTLRCAFSRDGARKVYVQDLLREDGREVWSLLGCRGGHLYICGGTAMGREVVLALQRTAVEHGKLSEAEAAAFVSRMEGEGRLVKELWS
ncbi:hypothetical protein EMIHUDRAFT_221860 [Emiliania huxleyi CCMP1516]|uniref:NADPH--hemoprotein reductase n=2 Tax=Emiliania huxleyi TaxID=2903 RepID=A0A0D3HXI0_EMIH1|nr:hypothetical protein EMIHUDRAFT_221860 [Emiliania huxleyi CCMP1516]EOD03715.1 hypothetical protein EMIHUDRAFT_221860 [Emiliania huxleyi CCMP1516]|eukprot:XP_005756144.1 hypothetical protein EMIHUDRAFT_221860 [Emiliania huxleyi CCMP1516]